MTASSQIIPGVLVVLVGYLGTEVIMVLVIWSIAVTMITASYAGAMANIVDLAPNLAGPVLAFCQTIHMSASFLSPLINGIILRDVTNQSQWQNCFLLSSVVAITTYISFQIYGTAEVQSWNYPEPPKTGAESERLQENSKDDTE